MLQRSMLDYYARRASEYERVYDKPGRQRDLVHLTKDLAELVSGRDVLEVACGTGFWTQRYSGSARSVLAIDASREVLTVAEQKRYANSRVRFAVGDAYALGAVQPGAPDVFTAAVVAFWWSHVPTTRIGAFLRSLHGRLPAGAVVWICDNQYVEGSSTPISQTDASGDTYQRRRLADGSEHLVLKNFPTVTQLRRAMDGLASEVEIVELEYYWILRYVVA